MLLVSGVWEVSGAALSLQFINIKIWFMTLDVETEAWVGMARGGNEHFVIVFL